jgi:hypothetical protein
MMLDQWQEDVINDTHKYILICKGRQIGGTTVLAHKAVKWMLDKQSRILVGSITEDQAKLVIVMVYDILYTHCKDMICKGKKKPTQDRIQLKNGAEIRSRAVGTMGDAFRGFTADVNWLNEAAAWSELAITAIMPTLLTTGGEIWGDSTPRGKQGFFWKAFQNKESMWKIYHKSSEDVIFNRPLSEHWTQEKKDATLKFLNDQKKEMSTLQYGQEYLGLFLDDLQRLFSDEMIEKVCILKRRNYIPPADYYGGMDIARLGADETVLAIGQRLKNDTMEQVENIITKKQLTTHTQDMAIIYTKLFDLQKLYIDAGAGSLGVGIYDNLLRDETTKRVVVAINNRSRALDREGKKTAKLLKEDLYMYLLSCMEHNKIKLLDDTEIKLSLRSIQYEFSTEEGEGGKTYMKIFGNYSHCVEAIIRMVQGLREKRINIWADSIKV